MTGRTLTLSALVALTQAKAIVTNHCSHEVYIWSIPHIGSSHTDNVPIKPGGRYEEPWRYGYATNTGVAIKISPEANGIHEGKDEINFAYSIEHPNQSKIWIDLSSVRGKAFDNDVAFHTCHGSYQTPDISTECCDATDDIELVLCGTARTTPTKDLIPFDKIRECYDYHHYPHEPESDNPNCTPDCHDESEDEQPTCTSDCDKKPGYGQPKSAPPCDKQPGHPECTKGPGPHRPSPKPTANKPYPAPPMPYTEKPHSPPPKTTSEKHYDPPKHTTEHRYAPPKPTADPPHYPPPKHTSNEHHGPPKHTNGQYPPAKHTDQQHGPPPAHTEGNYPPPKPTNGQHGPPKHTDEHGPPRHTEARGPPKHTEGQHGPPKPTAGQFPPHKPTNGQHGPPKPTAGHYPPHKPSNGQYPPHKPTDGQHGPPKPTDEQYGPPTHTEEQHGPPKPTAGQYPPHKPTNGQHGPPKPTAGQYPPPKPTNGQHGPPKFTGQQHGPPAHTEGQHGPPKHTDGQHGPPQQTDGSYPPPDSTSEERYPPPMYTSDEHRTSPGPSGNGHYPPSRPTQEGHYPPHMRTSGGHRPPPRPTSNGNFPLPPPRPTRGGHYPPSRPSLEYPHHAPPKNTAGGPHYPAPSHTTDASRYPPPRPNKDDPHHPHHPPKYTTNPSSSSPYQGPPEHTTDPSSSLPYQGPPKMPTRTTAPRPEFTRKPYPQPPQSTGEQPYAPPAKPTHWARNIESQSTCHKTQCNKPPVPNHCLARVVYPGRRAALLRDRNNTSVQTKLRTTIPLGTVLQLEAVKRGTATQAASPLCDIATRYYPGITDCNEEEMEVYVKETYNHLCDPEYEDILQGADCNEVKEELKKIFPDVDKPLKSHPGVALNATLHTSPQKRETKKICISELCYDNRYSKKACEEAEDLLEQVSKDENNPKDYTTDDDACGGTLASHNVTIPTIARPIFSKTPATLIPRVGNRICIRPYCKDLSEEACKKAKDFLEQQEEDDGKDVEYTNENSVCGTGE